MQATTVMTGYPVDVSYSGNGSGSRLSIFFRSLLLIPVAIVQAILSYAYGFTSFLAWFAILFTGRYPESLYNFGVSYMRLSADITAYFFLLTGEYPPFWGSGAKAESYPIQLTMTYPQRSSRLLLLVRWLLVIPHYVVLSLAGMLGMLMLVVAWVVALVTGDLIFRGYFEGLVRYAFRVNAYIYLMTDRYPPFSWS